MLQRNYRSLKNPRHTMTLPVSMEDTELFPKTARLDSRPGSTILDIEIVKQMRAVLSRLWWSRLVISVRGYVVNYVQTDEMTLFHCDDAFTALHRYLAEEKCEEAAAELFLSDLATIISFPLVSESLLALAKGHPAENPFTAESHQQAFVRVFGQPNIATYQIGEGVQLPVIGNCPSLGQKHAYFVFMRVLCILQERWRAEKEKKKGIRFETDPEWQPDDRVVLFQEFYTGNRTWVLLDFDRYILAQWRPRGASIIFGDRFVEKKTRSGLKLCSYCGMIEQQAGQFPSRQSHSFCSPECADSFVQNNE